MLYFARLASAKAQVERRNTEFALVTESYQLAGIRTNKGKTSRGVLLLDGLPDGNACSEFKFGVCITLGSKKQVIATCKQTLLLTAL
ncbi:hypothetical protein A9R01_03620 ['Osedax' symbiont bacterium Rs2_46_30_T18]|nr:hypothetical protein A9R01_03620 ['Osedax' symbiont bacterium Rs2_46_30_T18]